MQTSFFTAGFSGDFSGGFSGSPSVACVDIPAFPLQLVLREHPDWVRDPVVVVEEDRPGARILWANRPAREHRIRRGLRFAHAQSLVARLHGEVVSEERVALARETLFRRLLDSTPHVEPDDVPGRFWLDPTGLAPLYGSLERWASRVHVALAEERFVVSVVVGWKRGQVLALARLRTGSRVLPDPDTESREAAEVPLSRMDLSPELLDSLRVLGVNRLGELLALPAAGLRLRYGREAEKLHAFASGDAWLPLRPQLPTDPPSAEIPIDPPDDDHARLLFGIKGALHRLLAELEDRGEGVAALQLTLALDHAEAHRERIEAASPTLDAVRLVDLVRLRLASRQLPAPVECIRLVVETRPVSPRQAEMLRTRPRRDRVAAARALARLKAAFGAEAVVRARIVPAWLPEARFRWEPISEIPLPRLPDEDDAPVPLVRGLRPVPLALPDPPRHERERWLGTHGAVESLAGPGRIVTGWWETPADRDYYWALTKTGECLWIFREKRDRRWFLHGALD
jgi:protein ImuB